MSQSAFNFEAFRGPSVMGAVPAGVVLDFAGPTAPNGFLLCDGAAVSRTDYADLFSAIGTTWGVGDGSTTFNVPDFRGRSSLGAGQGSGLTNRGLGAQGGEENHQLSEAELAAHTHTQNSHNHTQNSHTHTDSGHTHAAAGAGTGYRFSIASGGSGLSQAGTNVLTAAMPSASANISTNTATNQAATATNQNTGGDTAHNTMHPFLVVNKIIKT
jgi:microcystin-dependent protein